MSQSAVVGFVALSLAVIVVPGPSVMFAISRAIVAGRRNALLAVLGNACGLLVQIVVIALGLGYVVTGSELVRTVLRLGGAVYLVWLGIEAIRHQHAARQAVEADTPQPTARPFRQGFVVGVANPKSFVFLAALLPRCVEPDAGPVPLQMLLLGALFCAIAIVSDGSWAVGAAQARRWLSKDPRWLAWTSVAGGSVMIVLGLVLALG